MDKAKFTDDDEGARVRYRPDGMLGTVGISEPYLVKDGSGVAEIQTVTTLDESAVWVIWDDGETGFAPFGLVETMDDK